MAKVLRELPREVYHESDSEAGIEEVSSTILLQFGNFDENIQG